MSFKLSLISLVYPTDSVASTLDVNLLQKANAWLQRRQANFADDFLLIGVGFIDETALRAMLKPYGLASAEVAWIAPEEFDPTDSDALGEAVSAIAESWISKRHGSAIPVADWKDFVPEVVYPTEAWWWIGLEANDDEQGGYAEMLMALLPDAFKDQALTWATLFAEYGDLNADGEEHETHEASMKALALARWLVGFDAATENNFYDFSASDAIESAGLDTLRLGFDAGRNHESKLADYFDGNDYAEESLTGACLLACLDDYNRDILKTFSIALGGDDALFWSLYSSIWPNLKQPMLEAMNDLLNLRMGDEGELERPWRFVTEGWIEFAEE